MNNHIYHHEFFLKAKKNVMKREKLNNHWDLFIGIAH